MEASDPFHVPAALTPVSILQDAVCAPDSIWRLWRREKSVSASAILPLHLGCPVRRLVNVLTELSRQLRWSLDQTDFFLSNVSFSEKLIKLKGKIVPVLN
jgi:hypothetical protein